VKLAGFRAPEGLQSWQTGGIIQGKAYCTVRTGAPPWSGVPFVFGAEYGGEDRGPVVRG